jgi:hypothetical protein
MVQAEVSVRPPERRKQAVAHSSHNKSLEIAKHTQLGNVKPDGLPQRGAQPHPRLR